MVCSATRRKTMPHLSTFSKWKEQNTRMMEMMGLSDIFCLLYRENGREKSGYRQQSRFAFNHAEKHLCLKWKHLPSIIWKVDCNFFSCNFVETKSRYVLCIRYTICVGGQMNARNKKSFFFVKQNKKGIRW